MIRVFTWYVTEVVPVTRTFVGLQLNPEQPYRVMLSPSIPVVALMVSTEFVDIDVPLEKVSDGISFTVALLPERSATSIML